VECRTTDPGAGWSFPLVCSEKTDENMIVAA